MRRLIAMPFVLAAEVAYTASQLLDMVHMSITDDRRTW